MDELEYLLVQLANPQTQVVLNELAGHYSPKTKLVPVPRGTQRYWLLAYREDSEKSYERVIVELYPFFGMMVGYNAEFDVLVCCKI